MANPAAVNRTPVTGTAVIVDAVRTAGGKRNGKLKDWHPVDLAAETLKALVERNDLDPGLVEDVIIAGSVNNDEAKEIFGKWKEPKPYIRIVPQPK